MGKEGWGLCMAGLTPLLKDCAERGDWASGLAVWKQIQALKFKSDRHRVVSEQIGMEAFAAMLRLCTTCDQRDVFDSIWKQASTAWKGSMEKIVSLVKGDVETRTSDRNVDHMDPKAKVPPPAPDAVDLSDGDSDTDTRFWQQYDSDLLDNESSLPREYRSEERGSILQSHLPIQTAETHKGTRPHQSMALHEQQLLGMLPPSHELDDYELRERPMSASG
jgi:hypothetical protein